jgi:S1-C subfamily serine protease
MTRQWLGASVALLMALTPALAAQGRAGNAREAVRAYTMMFGRPRIGVTVATDSDRDAAGARIESVTPDGPAHKAGLRDGDVITRFGETSLRGESAGRQLVELAQALEPGDTVRVEYRRGNDRRNATIVAQELSGNYVFQTMPRGRIEQLMPALEGLRNTFTFYGSRGLELAELNEGLGEYFGTSKGVLVLKPPADSTLPLRAGDVILSIDGREPQSVSHAMRIMSSYAPGESVRFEVMRQKRSSTVTWTVSEREGVSSFNMMHREPMKRPAVRLRSTGPVRGQT